MPKPRLLCWMSLAAVFFQLPVSTVRAQPKPGYDPSSTHIFPAGARPGTTVKVAVGAECIPPLTRFTLFGKGVRASGLLTKRIASKGELSPRRKPTIIPITIPREWESEITIAKDAPPGRVYWRLSCAQGGTALRPFVIGDLPEFIESESNSTPQTAERITLPVTVNGRIFGERDNDYFRFAARRGDVVVCDVFSHRIQSRLDPLIEILDGEGRPVRVETAYAGRDPVLAFRAETNGEYLLRVANISYHGDPAHVYRVNLSTRPFVRSVFPTTGQSGTGRDVEFQVMTGTDKPRIVKRRVRFPKEKQHAGFFGYSLREGRSTAANSVALRVVNHPAMTEREPNDSTRSAQPLKLPVTIDGRTSRPSDVDWFSFRGKKGVHYEIDCEVPAAGSAAWPTLLLADETGRRLQFQRSVEQADRRCRFDWQAPADGTYRIRIRDQRYGARGGSDFIYRLTVRKATPDFELSLASEFVNLAPEKTVHVAVSVRRFGGFEEPISLQVLGLPKGVTAKTELIQGKLKRVEIAIKCDKTAVSGDATLRIIGRGRAGLKKLEHAARSTNMRKLVSSLQAARGMFSGDSRHSGPPEGGTPALADSLHLTVRHRPVFRLYCAEAYQYAHRGSVFMYPMTVERLNGFDGEIIIQVADRQNRDMDGIEIHTVKVPPMKSEAIVPIYLPETMHINVQSQSQLYSQAYAIFKDTHGNRQSVLVLSEKRNMLRTLPPVVKLQSVDKKLTGKPGGTVKCRLRLERTSNFPGAMTVELRPETKKLGVLLEAAQFQPGQIKRDVVLHLPKTLPDAPSILLRFRATGRMKDGTLIISETTVRVEVSN